MSRVVLLGYYGFHNAGDEAILYSIIKALRESSPDMKILVLSNTPSETSVCYGVEAVNRWSIKEIYFSIRNSDLFISGGGSLLQDVTGLKSLIYYLGIIFLAKLLGKPVMFYAQGIGPINSSTGRLLTGAIANRVDLITVRDTNSRRELENLGVVKPKIKVTSDPVMVLTPTPEDKRKGSELLARLGIEEKLGADVPIIGVSVRPWPDSKVFMEGLAVLCDDLVELGWSILFIPMHFPGDLMVSKKVAEMMKNEAYILEEEVALPLFLGVMSNLEFLMGMRLHSLVFAAVAETPFMGISYDPKVDIFVEQIGQANCGYVGDLNYEKLRGATFDALDRLPQFRQTLLQRVPALHSAALETAGLAVNLAEGKTSS